ncbi:hypothetical protein THF1C08_390028 [Vibrio jasicida]|uniref:Uncharacterized protein n=1 Tax=Vibrio jasicida TaxID=766224 RepID=A0AAU9QQN8_9VIBR|nr:hypothetical protein THF1C08_390028 [Vibrio jasicida]CAH1598985.1 hypothetical protein THF1A12_390028 [Vibrio jasicida]
MFNTSYDKALSLRSTDIIAGICTPYFYVSSPYTSPLRVA